MAAPAPHIALVTARAHRDRDADLEPLAEALRRAGCHVSVPAWDDGDVDWTQPDLAVLRSPWDYVARYDEFLAWLDRAGSATAIQNRPDVVRWSTDKRYLLELAAAGVPIVPTQLIEPGEPVDPALLAGEVVVKPVVSAGSRHTARHTDAAAARAHAEELLGRGRAVLVQPYQPAVDHHGETAMVFFGGTLSHGLRKGPLLTADAAPRDHAEGPTSLEVRVPSGHELDLAARVLAAAPPDLLYARVDCLPGPDGRPVLLELELAEPSFFVTYVPGAADRFARAVLEHLAA